MTREPQIECIEESCDAFKRMVLAKESMIPPNWEDAEIRQWVMDCAKNAWVTQMDKARMRRYQMAKQVYGL